MRPLWGGVQSELGRIRYYKKISAISDEKSKNSILAELEEEFGMPPVKVYNLIEIALLKKMCASLFVKRVSVSQKDATILFRDADVLESASVKNALNVLNGELSFGGKDGAELRLYSKKPGVMRKVEALIAFVKAARGEAIGSDDDKIGE